MAKTETTKEKKNGGGDVLRLPAEILFAAELEALAKSRQGRQAGGLAPLARGGRDLHPRRQGGRRRRSPRSTSATRGSCRSPSPRWPPTARCLLVGEPGTAKSWLSEHLAAAISGDACMLVQGTAGTTEEQIRYTLELRAAARRGAVARRRWCRPRLPGDGRGQAGPLRGDHPLRRRGAGRAHHASSPRRCSPCPSSAIARARAPRASTSSPPPTRATAASTTCRPRSSAASTSSCCPCPRISTPR